MGRRKGCDVAEIVDAKTKGTKTKPQSKAAKDNLPAKKTCKLSPVHVELIVEMTLNGYPADSILEVLSREYGVTVTKDAIYYYRTKVKERLAIAADEEIARARAMIPELATLTGRLTGLKEIIEKEKKKKKASAYAVIQAYTTADSTMYHAEIIRLRYRESLAKFPERRDDEAERIQRELERRSHIVRNVTEIAERAYQDAEEEFLVSDPNKPIVVQAEIASSDDLEDGAEEGLGEDALTG